MCGITGLVGIGNSKLLNKMTTFVAHRGPDNHQIKWFDNFNSGLGHRRLSIIELSDAGNQPMPNDNKTLWISYNGELYNYREIRDLLKKHRFKFYTNSDTEVVLKSYEYWGVKCLEKFNGMFAFTILNSLTGELFAARDQVGIKPFYYSHINKSLIFASEVKAILKSGLVTSEPDYFALHTPTRFQISPYTGFKNILKLPPAHYLIFKNGELSINKYWAIKPIEKLISEEDAVSQLDRLLQDAVKYQMVADVEVGAFLSGGVDSSIITALMTKHTAQKIRTFTIKFQQEDQNFESMPEDSKYARLVAEKFGFNHQEIVINPDIVDLIPKIIWHLDEPLADAAAINTYLISKMARDEGIIVLLNGMGGDEIFGGYRKHLACMKADLYNKLLPSYIQATISGIANKIPVASNKSGFRLARWGKRFLSFASLPKIERYLSSDLSLNPEKFQKLFSSDLTYWDTHFFNSQKDHFSPNGISYLTQMCYNDTVTFLPEHNLTYSDKATMAASIESRPPLTDINVIEFMFTLPQNFRIKGNQQKYLLRKVAEKYLPSEIVNRPKVPFGSPLRSWIRGGLKEMVNDYLSFEAIKRRGLYNPDYVIEKIKLDRDGKEDNAQLIWQLLISEIWFRTFFN